MKFILVAIGITYFVGVFWFSAYAQIETTVAPPIQTEMERNEERKRLIEKLNNDWEAYKLECKDIPKPCKEFLSNRTLNKNSQKYRDSMLEKIRETAESILPDALIEDGRYGATIISIELDRYGKLQNVRLIKKSDIKLINEFAVELVKKAQPYPQFEGLINEDIDIVVLTESFQFNTENRIKYVEKSNQQEP